MQLSNASYRGIVRHLEPVEIQAGQIIYEAGDQVSDLYFPQKNTMLSLLCTTSDANAVEVGVTGWEGFSGFACLLGSDWTPHQIMGQIPGAALKIKASVLLGIFHGDMEVRTVLLRYVQAVICQISQTALCNRIHSVEERLARWTLVSQDRTEARQLPLTHELLARMLGVNRSTVSLTAGVLQQAGVVRYSRGKFTILNRARLLEIACGCYGSVKEQYQRLGIF